LPEVFFFTELATDPRFKTSDPDVICMPCAMCKSNTHLADEICRGTFMFERHLLNQLSTTALESVRHFTLP
jgi:hypothetical protein